jgi:hypothetical protein
VPLVWSSILKHERKSASYNNDGGEIMNGDATLHIAHDVLAMELIVSSVTIRKHEMLHHSAKTHIMREIRNECTCVFHFIFPSCLNSLGTQFHIAMNNETHLQTATIKIITFFSTFNSFMLKYSQVKMLLS